MSSELKNLAGTNPVELAILAKWLLQETSLCIMQVLDHRCSADFISHEKKTKLQEMHTVFFYQAFYMPVHNVADVHQVLQNLRKMLSMLKELNPVAWSEFMTENKLS